MSSGGTRRMVAIVVAMLVLPLTVVFFLVRALTVDATSHPPLPPAPVVHAPPPPPPATAEPTRPAEDRSPEIRGRILDAEGNPVRGAAVRLVSATSPTKVLHETSSERDGAFSFAHLAPGRARVDAAHDPEGFVSSAVLTASEGRATDVTLVLSATSGVRGTVMDGDTAVPGVTISIEGVPWALPSTTSDESGGFHLTIVPDEATFLVAVARGYRTARVALPSREDHGEALVRIQLAAAAPVEGEVAGVDGEAVPAAQVVACAGQASEVRATSGEDGSFELPSSAVGCEVLAEREGFAASEPVTAESGQHLRLRLKPGGVIEGVVVDDRGVGVQSYTLGIESYSSPRRRGGDGGGPRKFEDAKGWFRWDKLAPGSYVLTASAPGRPNARSESVEVAGGAATHGVRIVLGKGGAVSGVVTDESHAPLADVEVAFDVTSSVFGDGTSAKTDERGRYRIESAPAGPLTLRVQKAGFRTHLVSGLRVASGATITADVVLVASNGRPGMELGGIGASVRMTDQGIELGAVGAGDPAGRAGLADGDRVVMIDGVSTDGMSAADVIQRLRGQAGSNVEVSVLHKSGETLDAVIERGTIVR